MALSARPRDVSPSRRRPCRVLCTPTIAAVRFVRPTPSSISFRPRQLRDRCPATSYCRPSRTMVPICPGPCLGDGPMPASTTSIRTSTGRAVCGSVISTTIATACSRSSHSTLVIRCRAVSSITTESWRTRKRTGAHSSPARGGTHSVTAMSQARRPRAGGPDARNSIRSCWLCPRTPVSTSSVCWPYSGGTRRIQRRGFPTNANGIPVHRNEPGDGVVDRFPRNPGPAVADRSAVLAVA